MPRSYTKKPVTIQAERWTGDNYDEIREWAWTGSDTEVAKLLDTHEPNLMIWNTEEGQWIKCPLGHWVIRGLAGEYYPCSHDVFVRTYELAEE